MGKRHSRSHQKQADLAPDDVAHVGDLDAQHWYRSDRALAMLAVGASLLVFINSLSGQFLYDDWYQIERNPSIRSWSFLSSVFSQHVWQFANSDTNVVSGLYYRPIFNLALLVNYQLFGLGVAGWHAVSIAMHLAATALVYALARLWSLSKGAALFAALLFGVHPVHVEAVAWASALPDLLLGVFVLGSLVLYEMYRAADTRRELFFWPSIFLALLAAGVKETGVVVPVFILVREVLDRQSSTTIAAAIRPHFARILVFGVIAAAYLAARYSVLGFITATNPLAESYTPFQAIITLPYIGVQYLRSLVTPYPLSFIYDYRFLTTMADIRFWGSLLVLAAVGFAAYRFAVSRKAARFAIALFLLFLLPVLNLRAFSPIESIAHDRYLYLPSAGFLILAAMAVEGLYHFVKESQKQLVLGGAALIIVIFAALTYNQNKVWASDTVLTEHAISLSPDWPFLYIHLGEVYAEDGRMPDAEAAMKRAIELAPDWPVAHSTLANLYIKMGRPADAEAVFKDAVRLGQKDLTTQNNLAANFIQQGKIAEAKEVLAKAVAQSPDNAIVNYNLGLVSEKENKPDAAEQYFRKAIAKDPSYVDPRVSLGNILVRQGRIPQALEQINAARALDPENTELLITQAGALLQSKQCIQAIEPLQAAQRSLPNSARLFVMLGLSFECAGQTDNAKTNFKRAIEAGPQEQYAEVARRHLEQLGGK